MHPPYPSSRHSYLEKKVPATSEPSCPATNSTNSLADVNNIDRDHTRNANDLPPPSTDHNQQQHIYTNLHHINNEENNKAALAPTAVRQTLHSGHAATTGTSDQRPASIALSSFSSVTIPVVLSPSEVICAPLEPPKAKSFSGASTTSTLANSTTGAAFTANHLIYDSVPPMTAGAANNDPVHTTIKLGPFATTECAIRNELQTQQSAVPAANTVHSSEATIATPNTIITTINSNNNSHNNVFRVAQYIRRPMIAPNSSLVTTAAPRTVSERSSNLRHNQSQTAIAFTSTNMEHNTTNRPVLTLNDIDGPSCIYSCHYNFCHVLKTLFCIRINISLLHTCDNNKTK
ncbi:hypothetical protein BDF19DRAFT_429554 [Syncephalis fuscata]|nr:hypothetical protein BDF19DRAFT_429554 [Syncephalis fuscata]